jgi:hypothetical protein
MFWKQGWEGMIVTSYNGRREAAQNKSMDTQGKTSANLIMMATKLISVLSPVPLVMVKVAFERSGC